MSFSAQNSPGEMTHEMISDAQQLIFNPTGQEGTLASQAIAPISMLPVEDMSSSSNSNVESSQSHDSNHQKHAQPSPRPHPRSKPIHLRTASSSLQSQPTFAPISPETPIREQIRGGTDELDLSSLVTPPALRPPFPTPLQSAKHNQVSHRRSCLKLLPRSGIGAYLGIDRNKTLAFRMMDQVLSMKSTAALKKATLHQIQPTIQRLSCLLKM